MGEWLDQRRLSDAAAADLLATGRITVYRWRMGLRLPGAEYLVALARQGLSIDWLLTGKGSPLLVGSPDERYEAGVRVGMGMSMNAIAREALVDHLSQGPMPSGEIGVVRDLVTKVDQKRDEPIQKPSRSRSAKTAPRNRK